MPIAWSLPLPSERSWNWPRSPGAWLWKSLLSFHLMQTLLQRERETGRLKKDSKIGSRIKETERKLSERRVKRNDSKGLVFVVFTSLYKAIGQWVNGFIVQTDMECALSCWQESFKVLNKKRQQITEEKKKTNNKPLRLKPIRFCFLRLNASQGKPN